MNKIIIIAGKNKIACNVLKYLKKNYIINKILGISNKNIYNKNNWQPCIKETCKELDIEMTNLENIYNLNNILFLSCEFDRIIKPELFKSKNLYNIHFSNLPSFTKIYTYRFNIK